MNDEQMAARRILRKVLKEVERLTAKKRFIPESYPVPVQRVLGLPKKLDATAKGAYDAGAALLAKIEARYMSKARRLPKG